MRPISGNGIVRTLPSLSTILIDPEAELALDPDDIEPPKKSSGVPPFINCMSKASSPAKLDARYEQVRQANVVVSSAILLTVEIKHEDHGADNL